MGPDAPSTAAEGPRLRVLLLLSWLNGGGAERVALHLLNSQALGALDVDMGVLRREGDYLGQADLSRVHHRGWGERLFPTGSDTSFYHFHRLALGAIVAPRIFRSIVEELRPDVVMSFAKGTNLVAHRALAGMGRRRPVWIAREGNNLIRATGDEATWAWAGKLAMALTRKAYRAADCVLVNSQQLAGSLAGWLGLEPGRVRVINNPIDIERIRRQAAEPLAAEPARPFIVSVGRLQYQKGHDILLRAFAASAFRDSHDVVLVGRGSEEKRLRSLAAELGIGPRVRFESFADNPWNWVARAELFVLPSRWEGFPNALGEALACDTAVLAADCLFGPGELIEHEKSGWLVPPEDTQALTAALDHLLDDSELRARLAAGGRERVEAFRLERIIPEYVRLFEEQAALGALRRSGEARDGEALRRPLPGGADQPA